ncbi:MAG: alpha/beta fold hydrolase [Anaerolineae bacterium]
MSFTFDADDLHGILTLPTDDGPHPAIVLVSGSANPLTGARNGASHRYFVDHARHMVLSGFAVLRYDPPGVGRSAGKSRFQPLDVRAEEALAALRYLQSRADIKADNVGLWGVSQGGWVIAMAAAQAPQDVSFIIADSAAGVSVAEQQVYGIEAQSRAAGLPEEDVTKATLFGRLLIDWQLTAPIYEDINQAALQSLGDGAWTEFAALVYEPGEVTPAEALQQGIEILRSIQDEPWAPFLYLKEAYLPQLESIPPEQVMAVRAMMEPNLLNDPKEYLTRVRCPVLGAFGADDLLVPAQRSAALYEQYLAEAGNDDVKIVVIPGVGHAFGVSAPGYADLLSDWLDHLRAG